MKTSLWGGFLLLLMIFAVDSVAVGQRPFRKSLQTEEGTVYVLPARKSGVWYRSPLPGLPILPRRTPGFAPVQI